MRPLYWATAGLLMRTATLIGVLALLAEGCFLFNTVDPDGGGLSDGGPSPSSDARPPSDGAGGDASSGGGDAAACIVGRERLCGPYCATACPAERRACSEVYHRCYGSDETDPRGHEQCRINLDTGNRYCYRGEGICLASERSRSSDYSWAGVCVDPVYCRWVLEQPELTDIRCRYSEGTLFEVGPPDEPCGTGDDPRWPLCGGRCGDTCPAAFPSRFPGPSCVGISETRGFGVCVPSLLRCGLQRDPRLDEDPVAGLDACEESGGRDCVCMLLSPMEVPGYEDRGWGVARPTCLAYRDRFPSEVRCLDAQGVEL